MFENNIIHSIIIDLYTVFGVTRRFLANGMSSTTAVISCHDDYDKIKIEITTLILVRQNTFKIPLRIGY